MPSRHLETTAATLLSSWTDSDTAMQIVGTSLGLFGPGLLDPTVVLGHETPLRNALFDVLLSLVEGGALDLRPTEDAGYAFRFRTDFATAALTPDTAGAVDIDAPSPYLAELIQVRRERDEALGRADFAEALAAERERLLRVGDAPRAKRPIRRARPAGAPPAHSDPPDEIDLVAIEAEEHAAAIVPEPAPAPTVPAPEADAEPEDAPVVAEAEVEAEAEDEDAEVEDEDEDAELEAEVTPVIARTEPAAAPKAASPTDTISGLPPAPVILAVPAPEPEVVAEPGAPEVTATIDADNVPAPPTKAPAKKAATKKTPPKQAATPKKRVAKKPATKPPAAEAPAAEAPAIVAAADTSETSFPDAAAAAPKVEIAEIPSRDVLWLNPPIAVAVIDDADAEADAESNDSFADDAETHRAKWSGYTLDKPRAHLSSVERIAEDG